MTKTTKTKDTPEMRESIFSRLAVAGFTSVSVEFSGSGDSGDRNLDTDITDATLCADILDLADNICAAEGHDWWNNDGGQGKIEFKVFDRKILYTCSLNEMSSISVAVDKEV